MAIRLTKKISAFTLAELMVVLLLTIVVVGLAFSILGLVQRQMAGIQVNYEDKTESNLLHQALWVDFNSHNHVEYNPAAQTIFFSNHTKDMTYYFQEGLIIRARDTFYTKFEIDGLFFNGQIVNGGKIDAIELVDRKESNEKRIFVYKKNTATDFMN